MAYGGPVEWGPQQPMGAAYGGLLKRFGARLLDGLIVGITLAIVFSLLPGFAQAGFLYSALATVLYFGYFVVLESSRGCTLGKQLLGLRVAGPAGDSPVTPDASFRRNAWMLLALLSGFPVIGVLAGLAYLGIVIAIAVTISTHARNQGLHDRFGGTVVLDRR
ncbi:MAG: RDD family protein [Egibacteraceae bacterium]